MNKTDQSNMPSASAAYGITPNGNRGSGLTSFLGIDYEKKKQKMLQELHGDDKDFAAKKKDLKTHEPHLQHRGLSLPIYERVSEKERLREERKKEYNLFLQEQAHFRKLKSGTPQVTSKPEQVRMSDAMNVTSQGPPLSFLNAHINMPPPPVEHPVSRRDIATLTEVGDNGRHSGTWNPGSRRRRRWEIHRPREPHSSDEELHTDEDEEFELRCRRRQNRWAQKPGYKEEKRAQEHRVHSAFQDIKEVEAPVVHDRIQKSDKQMADGMRTTTRSTAELATGLMIGAPEELRVTQMRKERYKQELLNQMAEQKRNKMMEKTLELRVAASGSTDPEKGPDRIKQLRAAHQQSDSVRRDAPHKSRIDLAAVGKYPNLTPRDGKPHEDTQQRVLPGKSQIHKRKTWAPGSGIAGTQGVPPLDFFSEDYHKDFTSLQGEVTLLRDDDLDAPVPPFAHNIHKTPYDAAYYNYGARNPLDRHPPQNHILGLSSSDGLSGGAQRFGNFEILHQKTPSFRANSYTDTYPMAIEGLHADKSKQRRESLLNYQEALRHQIEERKERKRREKEERERLDAKIEAEMMAYNPWGRCGGGAPIKDQNGNLVSDLNQMHRSNLSTVGAEARSPLSHRLSGYSDQSSPRQFHKQDRYKEDLKQQIEENKRKHAEERERIRIADEKEEQRLARERTRIQQEYEEEQRKKKKTENKQKNPIQISEPKTHRKQKVKSAKLQKEMLPQSDRTREKESSQLIYQRAPSPPIPTLQKKQENLVSSKSSSALSKLSSRTERSAPRDQPAPAKMPPLHEGQREVIKELSALRTFLRKEQRKLGLQQGLTGPPEAYNSPSNRRRPRVGAFESAKEEAVQPSARSPPPVAAHVDKQNIRELNQLKYRGTESHHSPSREEDCAMFPNPLTDAQSLDIQQQAPLREQQCHIRPVNRQEANDVLDHQLHQYHPWKKPGCFIPRDPSLPSEADFIDVNSGDSCEGWIYQEGPPQPSREHLEMAAPRRRLEVTDCRYRSGRHSQSTMPFTSGPQTTTTALYKTLNAGGHNHRSGLSCDEVDALSLRSALGRCVSVETVATEPWLRPETPDTVKHSGCREKPNSRMDAPTLMRQHVI
ncbi:LOW QUALITY PROTEIN: centrosome and spindle pole associated protein 1 [Leuresthes tenuis]|uniref:LOW QUALITY PROTEIN: centrosome and spindle pole associated protein 1 n=1 Tax=Leuresthes tenuis TaxID=355514 RepID=UPI003B505C15